MTLVMMSIEGSLIRRERAESVYNINSSVPRISRALQSGMCSSPGLLNRSLSSQPIFNVEIFNPLKLALVVGHDRASQRQSVGCNE